jgi:hypothetical protein
MVQVPAVRREAADPETVQTAAVVEEKLTGRPEVAVAERLTVVPATWPVAIPGKAMIWPA